MSEQRIARIQSLIELDRWPEALKEIQSAKASFPEDPRLAWWETLGAFEVGRHKDGVKAAERGLALAPDTAYSHYLMGYALARTAKYKKAKASLQEALRLEPDDPDAWTLLGRVQLIENDLQSARVSAEEALRIDSEHANALELRAEVLTQLRSPEASQAVGRVMRQGSSEADAHVVRGGHLLATGKPKEAMVAYREALRLEPNNLGAVHGLQAAIRETFPPYRWVMVFERWMMSFGKFWWLPFLIGVAARPVLRAITRQMPPHLQWIGWTLVAVVGMFLWGWVLLQPLTTLMLRFHPMGRYSLQRADRIQLAYLYSFLAMAAVAGAASFVRPSMGVVVMGCGLGWLLQGLAAAVQPITGRQERWQHFVGIFAWLVILMLFFLIGLT